jgi:hypothetical protein
MKKNGLFLAMLGTIFALGLIVSACKPEPEETFETWESPVLRVIVAEDGSYKEYVINNGREFVRGTWSVSGTDLTITITQVNLALFTGFSTGDSWSSYADLSDSQKEDFGGNSISTTLIGDSFTITAYDGGEGTSSQTFTKQ